MNEEIIARICWNENLWRKPSGRYGKSKNRTFEGEKGFGYEEWLLDTSKLIRGFHYGFLQPIHNGWANRHGKIYDIFLYSRNAKTKKKWWIGKIKNLNVISKEESKEIRQEYTQRGWIDEMYSQLERVGIQADFAESGSLFCVKYCLEDLELLDEPIEIEAGDNTIKAAYYVLINKQKVLV